MNQRTRTIFNFIGYGILFGVLTFLLFGGLVYGKMHVEARNAVEEAKDKVLELNDKGYYGLQYHLDRLDEKKDSLPVLATTGDLVEVREFAEETSEDLQEMYDHKFAEKKDLFETELQNFQADLVQSEDLEIEGTAEFRNIIEEYQLVLREKDLDLRRLEEEYDPLVEEHKVLSNQIDKIRKEKIFNGLRELDEEAEELANFYNMRSWLTEEQAKIADYQSKVDDVLTLKKYKEEYTYKELSAFLEDEVYPILDDLRKEKSEIAAEEKERRKAWVEAEKAKWQAKGTTPPEAPKKDAYKLIYINIASQTLYAYEGGDLIHSTLVTTGKVGYETPKGEFAIYYKASPTRLKSAPGAEEQYDVHVDYWMPFYSGYGIHDSCNSVNCWRSVFGYNYYIWGGSHGCINTPYNSVKFLYNWAEVGTTVYID